MQAHGKKKYLGLRARSSELALNLHGWRDAHLLHRRRPAPESEIVCARRSASATVTLREARHAAFRAQYAPLSVNWLGKVTERGLEEPESRGARVRR